MENDQMACKGDHPRLVVTYFPINCHDVIRLEASGLAKLMITLELCKFTISFPKSNHNYMNMPHLHSHIDYCFPFPVFLDDYYMSHFPESAIGGEHLWNLRSMRSPFRHKKTRSNLGSKLQPKRENSLLLERYWNTSQKTNILNLTITPEWKGYSSSKAPFLGSMLVFGGVWF